jgi:hypothetical protein
MARSRTEKRGSYQEVQRIELLEDDADTTDAKFEATRIEMSALRSQLTRVLFALIAASLSFVAAAAAIVVFGRG